MILFINVDFPVFGRPIIPILIDDFFSWILRPLFSWYFLLWYSIFPFRQSYKSDKPSPCSAEKGITSSKPSETLSLKPSPPLVPSLLLTKIIVGLSAFIKLLAYIFSTGKTPTLPSITKITMSESSRAIKVWALL